MAIIITRLLTFKVTVFMVTLSTVEKPKSVRNIFKILLERFKRNFYLFNSAVRWSILSFTLTRYKKCRSVLAKAIP